MKEMTYDNCRRKSFGLEQLPVSSRTLSIGNRFVISDNYDSSSLEDVLNIPGLASHGIFNVPFRIKFSLMMVCTGGSLVFRMGMREYEMKSGDMLVIIEDTIVECIGLSPDARLMVMAFSRDFDILEAGVKLSPDIIGNIAGHPLLSLDETEIDNIISIYGILRERLSDPDFSMKEQLAVSCMRTALCYVSRYLLMDYSDINVSGSCGQRLLNRFLNLVDTYGVSMRNLSFYAERLCVSVKYLSRIVSRESGKTARQWIDMRVMIEAKVLLKDSALSVQQISDRLNFPNQSFFGTFFKRHSGMSPNAYRK